MSTITRSMTILCPDWCITEERQAHDPWFTGEELHVDHQGPSFGDHIYGIGAQVDDVLTAEVTVSDLQDAQMSGPDLRALAADALAAAAWLEAQQ